MKKLARRRDAAGQLLRLRACSRWARSSARCSGSCRRRCGFDADRLARVPRPAAAHAPAPRRSWRAATTRGSTGRALTTVDADRPLRHALEVRHASFDDPAFLGAAARARVALVVADTAGRFPFLDDVTVRLRLRPAARRRPSSTSAATTTRRSTRWAARVDRLARDGRDVVVFFDNDAEAHAPNDALALAGRLGDRGGAGTLRA